MNTKSFGAAAAVLLAAAALPLAALADNEPPSTVQTTTTTTTTTTSTRPARAHVVYLAGAVTAASSSSVSIDVIRTGPHDTQLDGKNVTVAIDPSTKIVYGKGQTSIDPGDLVGVRAQAGDATLATLTAREIRVGCNCHFAAGTLGSVGSDSFDVNVERTGPYDGVLKGNAVTFHVNGSTVIVQGKSTTGEAISALKPGIKVAVIFAASGFFKDPNFNWRTATFTATHVRHS